MAARLIALFCIALGGLLYWAALGSDNPKAYFFPQMLALMMAAMGAVMLVTELRASADARAKAKAAWVAIPWVRILPGMLVLAAYMAVAETVGFYVSSWLAFTSIGIIYAPATNRMATVKRCLPIAVAFLAVLYLVFWTLLRVQLPHGFAF